MSDENNRCYLEEVFPRLTEGKYEIIGSPNQIFDCLATAIGQKEVRRAPLCKWTMEGVTALLERKGFRRCDNGEYEPDYEKIAIYIDVLEHPNHFAMRVKDGWHSKLGQCEMIYHETLEQLEDFWEYGWAAYFFKRPVNLATLIRQNQA